MDHTQQEKAVHERWLAEATGSRRGIGSQSDPQHRATAKPQPCWQCTAPASLQLPIGTVTAHLCLACAEQTRQLLTVALHGIDPLFTTDDEDADHPHWGSA